MGCDKRIATIAYTERGTTVGLVLIRMRLATGNTGINFVFTGSPIHAGKCRKKYNIQGQYECNDSQMADY